MSNGRFNTIVEFIYWGGSRLLVVHILTSNSHIKG